MKICLRADKTFSQNLMDDNLDKRKKVHPKTRLVRQNEAVDYDKKQNASDVKIEHLDDVKGVENPHKRKMIDQCE